MRLVTSSMPLSPPVQAASTNLAPECGSLDRAMWPALPVKLVPWALAQPAKSCAGAGTNTWAPPFTLASSTRVVTSKVRSAPG